MKSKAELLEEEDLFKAGVECFFGYGVFIFCHFGLIPFKQFIFYNQLLFQLIQEEPRHFLTHQPRFQNHYRIKPNILYLLKAPYTNEQLLHALPFLDHFLPVLRFTQNRNDTQGGLIKL